MNPVTGQYIKSETVLGPPNYYGSKPEWLWYQRAWYRQRRPYNLQLPFTYTREQVLSHENWSTYVLLADCHNSQVSTRNTSLNPSTLAPNTYNKAYERFKSKVAPDSASLGIALAQRKQAIDMVAARGLQLATFANQLRKGQFRKAGKTLNIKPPPGWKKKGRSFADNFLEAHFGWSPLVGDIGSAIDVLQGGVSPCMVRSSAKTAGKILWNTSPTVSPARYFTGQDDITWSIRADIIVSNPNLWLANQLGFVNPATILWDGIPFSFVVGWFVNVESFLSSFTDFWGLSLTNTSYTCHWIRDVVETVRQKDFPSSNAWGVHQRITYRYIKTQRFTGSIPGPTLRVKEPWILSPSRGLTSISLLLQKLKV